MADLRYDPLNEIWVSIARNRMQRPTEFVPIEQVQKQLLCPFCIGNEEQTPEETVAYDSSGDVGKDIEFWSTRVVPNKFPSFSPIENATVQSGPYQASAESGTQEIIIPSPRHIESFSQLSDGELSVAMKACRDRWSAIISEDKVQHAMLFMNCRSAAGASLSHIHLQLIGTPIVSSFLRRREELNNKSIQENSQSLVMNLTEWERAEGTRIIFETSRFIVYCPFASRFPVQVRIVPKASLPFFSDLKPEDRLELGRQIRWIVNCLEEILDKPAYNVLFHLPPCREECHSTGSQTSWYVEIFPRMTTAAGFEWGTNTWVNPVSPEAAAKRLKAFQNESIR